MPDEEVKHIHGTPIVTEPQSTKELYKLFLELAARVSALEDAKAADIPAPETNTVQ